MEFEKMVVDPSNTRLYVAGVNYLYDLHSSDLSVRVEAVTGPMDDSDQCKGVSVKCATEKTRLRIIHDDLCSL
uniref:Plexin A n=1 Tax=Haemonchus contortus TaxID=6289 RepID=W6NG34_HAECO